MNSPTPSDLADRRPQLFVTTRWTMVRRAGKGEGAQAAAALEELCAIYREPICVFIERSGYRHADAEDLTQSFLLHLLQVNPLNRLAPEHGRFRSYLLAMLKNFLATRYRHETRRKRGGGAAHLSLEELCETGQHDPGLQTAADPRRHFDRVWACTLLGRVIKRLRQDYLQKDRSAELELLLPHLTADSEATTYEELAGQLGIRVGAARVRIHRLRHDYQQLLRREVAETCDRESVEDELRSLLAAFANG